MKTLIVSIAAATLALGASAPSVAADKQITKGEERLAKLIDGRVAGKPVSCINTTAVRGMQIIDKVALVYDAGKTIYVARPAHPDHLDSFDVLVIERFSSSELCVHDQIHTMDRSSGFPTGFLFLKEFVPYTKEG